MPSQPVWCANVVIAVPGSDAVSVFIIYVQDGPRKRSALHAAEAKDHVDLSAMDLSHS